MGAKRAVEGRSKPYDELLLEWNRQHNPNFVEPVKRETKAEKKARKDKEKAEKKKQQIEAAAALGIDLTAPKKAAGGAGGTGSKKTKKTAAAIAATAIVAAPGPIITNDNDDNIDDIDSEEEVDTLVHAVRLAQDRGVMSVPLAVPCDASSWFVARRERLRTCRDLLANALMPARAGPAGVAAPGRLLG